MEVGTGMERLKFLAKTFRHAVWLNPQPEERMAPYLDRRHDPAGLPHVRTDAGRPGKGGSASYGQALMSGGVTMRFSSNRSLFAPPLGAGRALPSAVALTRLNRDGVRPSRLKNLIITSSSSIRQF